MRSNVQCMAAWRDLKLNGGRADFRQLFIIVSELSSLRATGESIVEAQDYERRSRGPGRSLRILWPIEAMCPYWSHASLTCMQQYCDSNGMVCGVHG